MTAPRAGAPAPVGRVLTSRRAPRLRTGIAVFLVVASLLAVMVSALALWSRSIVFDTETYVRVVDSRGRRPGGPRGRERVRRRQGRPGRRPGGAHRGRPAVGRQGPRPAAHPLAAALSRRRDRQVPRHRRSPSACGWTSTAWPTSSSSPRCGTRTASITVGTNDVTLNLLPLVAVALQRLEDRIPLLLGRDVTLPADRPRHRPDDVKHPAAGRPGARAARGLRLHHPAPLATRGTRPNRRSSCSTTS